MVTVHSLIYSAAPLPDIDLPSLPLSQLRFRRESYAVYISALTDGTDDAGHPVCVGRRVDVQVAHRLQVGSSIR